MENTNFDKDFEVLIDFYRKINLDKTQLREKEDLLSEKCNDFVNKYSLAPKLLKVGSIHNILNSNISTDKFKELLEFVSNNKTGGLAFLNSAKGHMSGGYINKDYINYDYDRITKLESRFKDLDSIEYSNSLNHLMISQDDYLITKSVEEGLKNGCNEKSIKDKDNFVYLVVFNRIKHGDDWVIIYNYIAYNKLFIDLLYTYIKLEQSFCILNDKEGYIGSDLFFILDKQLREDNPYFYTIDNKVNNLLGSDNLNLDLLNSYWYNFIQLSKWLVNGNIVNMGFDEIPKFLDFVYNKDRVNILNTLNKDRSKELLENYLIDFNNDIYNYLSRFVFIVSDLEKFIDSFENKKINQGPQKYRGNSNYISYILHNLDKGFRDSMYNHNRSFSIYPEYKDRYIAKSCFSYKNIHINLGQVRWYSSVKTTMNKENFLIGDNNFSRNNLVFSKVYNILLENPINKNTQLKIEDFIRNQFIEFIKSKDNTIIQGFDSVIFTPKLVELILDNIDNIVNYLLDSLVQYPTITLEEENYDLLDYDMKNSLIKVIFSGIQRKDLENIILTTFFKIITYNNLYTIKDSDEEVNYRNSEVTLTVDLGKNLVNLYIKNLYNMYNRSNSTSVTKGIYEFRGKIMNNPKYTTIDNENFYLNIGSIVIHAMKFYDLVINKLIRTGKKQNSIIVGSKVVQDILGNTVKPISIPLNLPMIVKPKKYGVRKLGGYLKNNIDYVEELFTNKQSQKGKSNVSSSSDLYDILNKMMQTPFKINVDLLDYLINYNHKHNLLIDLNKEHKYSKLYKRTKSQEKEYQVFTSEKLLQNYILRIACTFANIPEIYFPIFCDNRGRLYPKVNYLNYQGSELAKSLILFANGDVMLRQDKESHEYLYAYGAACYGNGLDKKSYLVRIQWVKDNWNDILNFENSSLVSEADEKFLFLSFCLELRRFDKFLLSDKKEFKTYLPIQLDGTCNGFQHLALMSNELDLFESLNLYDSNKDKDPKDFYRHLLNIVEGYLQLKYNECKDEKLKIQYKRIIDLGLTRKNVKMLIMTKPYNSTDRTLTRYLRSSLIIHNKTEHDNITTTWYKTTEDSKNLVNNSDLILYVNTLNETLISKYSKIKSLIAYLSDVATLHNKLNLAISWNVPTGLIVTQKYMLQIKKRVKPVWSSTRSLTLTLIDNVKIDKNKQKRALMPNLVHSLDASSLCILYRLFSNHITADTTNKNPVNFYSVHDCYGVTAPNVAYLIRFLQTTYINIYEDKNYLETFHNDIYANIIKSYGKANCNLDKNILTVNGDEYKYPQLPEFRSDNTIDRKTREKLSKALYLAS